MASSKIMAEFEHRNLQGYLSITSSQVKQMLADKNDAVLKFEYPRRLDEENLKSLKIVSDKLEELVRDAAKADGEKVFNLGVEEICDCSVHLRHLKKIGVVTLADFLFPKDPMKLLEALVAAEIEAVGKGLIRQPQMFTRIFHKIEFSVRKMLSKKAANNKNSGSGNTFPR